MAAAKTDIGVVCYSKSGHSRSLADRLAALADADQFELKVDRYRVPFFGYMRAGWDSLRHARPPFVSPLPDVSGYMALIICGPIWTSYPACPLRSYLCQAGALPRSTALALTCGDHSPPEKAYKVAERDFGRAFVAKTAIPNAMESMPEAQQRIDQFLATLDAAMKAPIIEVAGQ